MRTTLSTIAALATTVQFASAGFSDASAFSCPSNTNNHCNPQQSSGFDWSSLNLGSFSNYGNFDFSGWTCDSSFGGSSKRDALTGRDFQSKCITGSAHTDTSRCPSFGIGSSADVSAFSVTEFQVSVEFDCDLEFHYSMPSGKTCKQKSSCKSGGSTISNTQCGGAKNVTIVYPSQSTGTGKTKTSCSIGVHSMTFDCSSASSTVYHSTTTKHSVTKETSQATKPGSSQATTTSVSVTKTKPSSTLQTIVSSSSTQTTQSSGTTVGTTSTIFELTSSSSVLTSVSSAVSSPSTTPSTTAFTTSTVFTTFVSTIISCAESVTNCPGRSTVLTTVSVAISTTICPVSETSSGLLSSPVSSVQSIASTTSTAVGIQSTTSPLSSGLVSSVVESTTAPISSSPASSTAPTESEVITTVVVETSTTLCPVTLTHVTSGTTSIETSVSTSTVEITTTKTVCTKCEAGSTTAQGQVSTPAVTSATTSSSGPVTTAPCPDVLPSCLNTWLFSEGCSSNTDSDCYCPSSTFVTNVFSCLSAYGASDDEISAAQTFFQGICAAHIPENPAIVTAASTVTVTATAAYSSMPVTTLQVLTTLVVPCTETTGISAGSIIPSSSTTTVISTAITVPQVIFTTVQGSSTASAALVVGTAPAAVEAGTTFAVPASSTLAVVGTSARNGTSKPSASPTLQQSSGAGKLGLTVGSIVLAFVGVLAL